MKFFLDKLTQKEIISNIILELFFSYFIHPCAGHLHCKGYNNWLIMILVQPRGGKTKLKLLNKPPADNLVGILSVFLFPLVHIL